MSITTVVVEGVDIEVEYSYSPPCRGARDSFMGRAGAGPQLEPDEPASIDLEKVTIGGYEVFDLLKDSVIEKITEEVMERFYDKEDAYDCD